MLPAAHAAGSRLVHRTALYDMAGALGVFAVLVRLALRLNGGRWTAATAVAAALVDQIPLRLGHRRSAAEPGQEERSGVLTRSDS